MKRLLLIAVFSMVAASAAAGQSFTKPKPTYDKEFWWTTTGYITSSAADIVSSLGKREGNSMLRNRGGGISVPRAIVFDAGPLLASVLLQKNHPKVAKFIRLFGGAAHDTAAVWNLTQPRIR